MYLVFEPNEVVDIARGIDLGQKWDVLAAHPGAAPGAFDLEDMDNFPPEKLNEAQSISMEEWKKEILEEDELLFHLHDSLPKELIFQRELLVARL
jgi:GTP-dependent phosphoenolpyruvate carboxykinase